MSETPGSDEGLLAEVGAKIQEIRDLTLERRSPEGAMIATRVFGTIVMDVIELSGRWAVEPFPHDRLIFEPVTAARELLDTINDTLKKEGLLP